MGKHYSIEFKHHIVKLVLEKHWGIRKVAQHFHIAAHSSVVVWLQRFEKYGINWTSMNIISGLPRSTIYYKPKPKDHSEIRRCIVTLLSGKSEAGRRPTFDLISSILKGA